MIDSSQVVDTLYNVVLPIVGGTLAVSVTIGAIKARDSISEFISDTFRDPVKYQSMKALEASAKGSRMLMDDTNNGFSTSKIKIQGMIEAGDPGSINAYQRMIANEKYEFSKLSYIDSIKKSINGR